MKSLKIQLSLGLVCLVLGLMLSIQFKTIKQNVGTVSEYRARELATQLKKIKEERDTLLNIKKEYEKKISEFEDAESKESIAARVLRDELNKSRIIAGLVDVEGPGITVVVDDLKFSEMYNYNIIDYTMLLELLNELNAAGAEVVSINDQRVISTTEIRQAGLHININTIKFAPPFTFKAIGDPKTLEAALRMLGGIVDRLEASGISVSITQNQVIQINKYNGVIDKKFSRAIKEEGAE